MGAIVQYYNLIGGLNTIAGIGTINQSTKRTESPDMQNVEFYKLGGLQSMEGNTQFSKTVLTAPVALGHEYIYEDRKYLLVFTTDGNVWEYDRVLDEFVDFNIKYNLNEDSSVGRKLFEVATARYSAVNFNNGVVFTNGVEDLIYYKKNRHILTSGEASGTTGSNQITGTLTKFQTELHKGDFIAFGYDSEEYYIVEEVISDTELLLSNTLKSEVVNQNIYIGPFSYCNAMMIDSTDVEEENIKDLIGTPIRGLAIQSYQGRLWVGGTDGVLYYSEVGLYNGWDVKFGAGNFPEFYNDTSAFTALALWDRYLVICKRERTYLLATSTESGEVLDDTQWGIKPFSVNTVESQQSWIDCNNGLWGFSKRENGIYPILQRTIYNATFGGNDLSMKISDTFDYINQAKYDEIFPVYHAKKGYIMFYIPLLTGLGSNDCFCWDTRSKSWLHRKVPQEVTSAFEFNNDVYIGTKEGKVLKEFTGLTFDGEPIEFWWKSPWFYFGDSTNNKTTKEFRIKISEEATNKFKIRNRRDGRDIFKSRNISNNLDAFTGLVWDIDYQQEDLNSEYKSTRDISEITNQINSDIYYTPSKLDIASTVPLNTLLYSDELCRNLVGISGYINYDTEVYNPDESNKSVTVFNKAYRFTTTVPKYFKYTNGDDTIWIDFWTRYPSENIICKYNKRVKTERLAGCQYYVPTAVRGLSGDENYNTWVNLPVEWNDGWVTNQTEPELIPNSQWDSWFFTGGKSPSQAYKPTSVDDYGQFFATKHGNIYRRTFNNSTKQPYYSSVNGEATVDNAGDVFITNVVEASQDMYDITLDDGTVLEGMYVTQTEGTQTINLYSKVSEYKNREPIYIDKDLVEQVGRWQQGDGYNVNLTVNRFPLTLNTGALYYYETIKYYKSEPMEFIVSDNIEYRDPSKIELNPNYSGETLTDTVWDKDSWVISRQITKRFPLPDQYFETMQIEFYGNAIDEGMAIYGFEIDGVELEEVPVR